LLSFLSAGEALGSRRLLPPLLVDSRREQRASSFCSPALSFPACREPRLPSSREKTQKEPRASPALFACSLFSKRVSLLRDSPALFERQDSRRGSLLSLRAGSLLLPTALGDIKSYVSFAEYRLFYRALLQKRPIIYKETYNIIDRLLVFSKDESIGVLYVGLLMLYVGLCAVYVDLGVYMEVSLLYT